MAVPRRVTLKEVGAPDFVLQPLQVRHPELNANFELKTAWINLLPKFHGLSTQDPIRHLRDFQGVCSTTRREGSDEVAIWLFAFPFSLEGRAKEWFYTLPDEIVSDWNLLRMEFLDKFFSPKVTDRLRKEISCIVQGEMETLYEYWERFRRLLDSCPHHMIDTLVLISYFCQGMKPQDKILLDASRNGSLTKYRTAEEAWQLITDLAESTQHARQRNHHPRAINEVSSSGETAALTKTLGEMTNILNSSELPSQPIPNPKGSINATTLRFGTKLQERSEQSPKEVTQDEDVVEVEEVEEEDEVQEEVEDVIAQPRGEIPKDGNVLQEATPIPFPTLARKTKKQVELDPKMVEIFKKVERIHDLETIPLGSSISALMGDIPEKCGNPGPCLVTCTIDGVQFVDCMCDLGACVSIMSLSIYEVLKLPPLKRLAARFVLADKSIISVVGITEDVLVSIKGFVFPIDFHILKMPPSDTGRTSSIFLGRPFLKISRFKLDAFSVERNYHSEHLLAPPDHIIQYVMPRIERRQWKFLMQRPQEANLSWVVEFYTNYHSPSL
ncbi:uncharacterized protein LOC107605902 [Arachis ipaensis]|uniref:uncharacterized protein LOC107605902 n=1 Tax=Arachis ipaensis TaxID=130454 RepID=UPI0007AFBB59|nr:uncharacterized protein LOC107605902 [Arachis ipaensis]